MQFTFEYTAEVATTVKRLLARGGVSHRLFTRLRDAQLIWVDGQLSGNVNLRAGQTVRFALPEDAGVTVSTGAIDVVLENANWLIVNKPTHLASVPGPSNPDDSLLNRAAGYLKQKGIAAPHPAIITRLDRDTCGLVLIAKHGFAQGRLDQDPAAASLDKRYYALVAGELANSSGSVTLPLGPADDGIHQTVREDGKPAQTDYEVVQHGKHATIVECHLQTGRTHQIRVHMAQLGHPLLGDALYSGDTTQLHEQALIACKLSFTDPFTGKRMSAQLPMPDGWRDLL